MNGTYRRDVTPGVVVDIVQKQDQRTGHLTRGIVKNILTSSTFHPRGIKVRLVSGIVGRVQHIISQTDTVSTTENVIYERGDDQSIDDKKDD